MKRAKIIAGYYKGHKLVTLLLSLSVTILLFYALYVIADLTPYYKGRKLYEQAKLENSFYYVASGGLEQPYAAPDMDVLQSFPAVKDVVYLKYGRFEDETTNTIYNIYAFPDSTLDAFAFSTAQGLWLKELQDESDEEEWIPAVVCGDAFYDAKLESILQMHELYSGYPLQIKVKGKLAESTAVPYFGAYGGSLSTDSLFQIARYSNFLVFVRETDFEKIEGCNLDFSGMGCFVRFNEDAIPEDKAVAEEYLNETGRVIQYEDILLHGKNAWGKHLKEGILFPCVLTLIVLIAYIALFITIIEQKRTEIGIYYLCGYAPQKIFFGFMISALIPVLIPVLLHILFIYDLLPISKELILYLVFADISKTVEPGSIFITSICVLLFLISAWALAWRLLGRIPYKNSQGNSKSKRQGDYYDKVI